VDIGGKHLSLIEETFSDLKKIQGVTIGTPRMSSTGFNLNEVWQIHFGAFRNTAGQGAQSKAFRGYVMIEPESSYGAIQRIN